MKVKATLWVFLHEVIRHLGDREIEKIFRLKPWIDLRGKENKTFCTLTDILTWAHDMKEESFRMNCISKIPGGCVIRIDGNPGEMNHGLSDYDDTIR